MSLTNLMEFKKELNGEWYFWNETWSERLGPYGTKEEANLALSSYIIYLNGEHND